METTALTTIAKIPQPHGGALNAGGTPGNVGGGRPPGVFTALMTRLRESPELAKSLEAAIKDHESKAFPHALKAVTDYDTDKPTGKLDVTSGGKPLTGIVILPSFEGDAG